MRALLEPRLPTIVISPSPVVTKSPEPLIVPVSKKLVLSLALVMVSVPVPRLTLPARETSPVLVNVLLLRVIASAPSETESRFKIAPVLTMVPPVVLPNPAS